MSPSSCIERYECTVDVAEILRKIEPKIRARAQKLNKTPAPRHPEKKPEAPYRG